MPPLFLTLGEIVEIHQDQIGRYGGKPGIRDLGLLQSAAAMPAAGSRREFFHAFPFEMAAAYLFHIVKNHPFFDGNKRAGAAAALVFLEMNGVRVSLSNAELVGLVLGVTEGKRVKAGIAAFLAGHADGS